MLGLKNHTFFFDLFWYGNHIFICIRFYLFYLFSLISPISSKSVVKIRFYLFFVDVWGFNPVILYLWFLSIIFLCCSICLSVSVDDTHWFLYIHPMCWITSNFSLYKLGITYFHFFNFFVKFCFFYSFLLMFDLFDIVIWCLNHWFVWRILLLLFDLFIC